jgi:hypothetical protein
MALADALCVQLHAVAGFTNKSLRSLVAGLLGTSYTSAQMTYDLQRLRLRGLITRLPTPTPTGPPTKDSGRRSSKRKSTSGPAAAARPDAAPEPQPLRAALTTIDRCVAAHV